jgi:hypothetical protein
MKYARFNGTTAIEVFTVPTGFKINDCFHADVVAQFEPVADDVTVGWVKPVVEAPVVETPTVETPVVEETPPDTTT